MFRNKWLLTITILETLLTGGIIYLHIFDTPFYAWIMLPICILQILIAILGYERIKGIHFDLNKEHNKNEIFLLCFAIVLIGQLLYWFAYYPGGFNLDALGQWDQIHGLQQLNNWHPILTTFFYWILTRFNDNFEFCILVQLVVFALSISYFLRELYKNGISIFFVLVSSLVIAINPAIGMNNVCLIKDVPFTIVVIWTFFLMYKIYLSAGKCITYLGNRILLAIILSALSLIRHNAVFYLYH